MRDPRIGRAYAPQSYSIVLARHMDKYQWTEKPNENPDLSTMTDKEIAAWRESLVNYNVAFAIKKASQRWRGDLPFEDVVQESLIGLVEAAKRFDPSMGHRFISYATWWCDAMMQRLSASMSLAVRIPENIFRDRRFWAREIDGAGEHLAAGIEARERFNPATMISMHESPRSNGSTLRDGKESSLDEIVGDDRQDSSDDAIQHMLWARISEFIEMLPPRHADILIKSFGLDGNEPVSLENLGVMYGISRERARQIKEESLDAVRENKNNRFDGLWECARYMDGVRVSEESKITKTKTRANAVMRHIQRKELMK